MEEALLHGLKAAVQTPFAVRGFLAAYAYGSRVSGNPLPDSDLDVGYYLTGYRSGASLSLKDEALLASELSEILGVEVDLRGLADAPLELRGGTILGNRSGLIAVPDRSPESLSRLRGFPNPARGDLTIELTLATPGVVRLRVLDIQGTRCAC